MPTIKANCKECSATGLYVGFAEPKGTAVVCVRCGGTGCQEIQYVEFKKRRRRRGVSRVLCDGGMWFVRKGESETISVEKFYSKSD